MFNVGLLFQGKSLVLLKISYPGLERHGNLRTSVYEATQSAISAAPEANIKWPQPSSILIGTTWRFTSPWMT